MVDPVGMLAGYSGMIQNIIYILELVVVAAVAIFALWYILYLKKFDIQVEIRSVRTDPYGNKQWKILLDKGGWIKDRKTGATVFRLFKAKRNVEPPQYEYLEPAVVGMFVKNKAHAVQTDDDKLHWIKPVALKYITCPTCKGKGVDESNIICTECLGKKQLPKELEYKIADKDVEFWAATEMQADLQAFGKPKWWEPLILPMAGIIIFFMAMIVIWLILDKVAGVTGVCSAAQSACSDMARSCSNVPAPSPAPSPPGW